MKRPLLSKSSLMAVGLAAAAVVWMLTGLVGSGAPSGPEAAESEDGEAAIAAEEAPTIQVSVRKSTADRIVRNVAVSGRTEPNRRVELKAETEGRVVELGAERGSRIGEGELIAVLDVRDRNVRLEEAEAMVAMTELQYEAAQQLEGQQLIAEVQKAEALANLVRARTELEQIRLDLARTSIVAPFEGVLEERDVELGDYVGIGDPVAQIVDNDPLIAVGEVSEREVGAIEVGTPGRAELVNGEILEGTVRYVARVADESTRTFRIELAFPNPESALPAGMTAELRLPASELDAHFLSPALLTLDDAGNIGVKTVDEQDKVRFRQVEIVQSASDGVWVTGLPDQVRVITVGQGFVADGERVVPVPAEE